jgi:4-hydroxythreonine-4-phosphate dehydrogenase
MKQLIGITMGDPKGVGPEVVAKAWASMDEGERDHYLIYGDHNILEQASMLSKTPIDPKHVVTTSSAQGQATKLTDTEAARTAVSAIDTAVEDISSGKISAIVTAPVNKHRVQSVHPQFVGHTEYLAKSAHVREVTMMFFSEGTVCIDPATQLQRQLCISLVTMHVPLKDVPKAITKERVVQTIRRTHKAMEEHFACPEARIAVMALNPHAGESESIGHEDAKVIAPAVEKAEDEGINCVGPIPADSVFHKLADFDYDAVVAMYHDQGLLPVKLLCQGRCVNMTLGLPYIRTSPSHGTAEDIAWLGKAEHENMLATLRKTRSLVGWKIDDKP